jgi:multiple sugar transport system permease protein
MVIITRPRMLTATQYARARAKLLRNAIAHAFLILFSFTFVVPFAWMISTAFKTNEQMFVYPPIWIPNPITLQNYVYGFQFVPFERFILNTLQICVFTVIGAVLSNAVSAYGLARLRWRGRRIVFAVILVTMMVPFHVRMIPTFILFKTFGWINTYLPLIVPTYFANPFFVFLLRQFFLTIPRELSEAARIDGASEWGIFWRIILPLSRPALATVALFQFIHAWEDLIGPLIYLNDKNLYTVAIGLALFRGEYSSEWGPMMAASSVMIMPVILVFFFTQRTFIQGITLTGIKG